MKRVVGSGSDYRRDGGLRVVGDDAERSRPDADPEMKAVLDDTERRYPVRHERPDVDCDTPEVAQGGPVRVEF